MLDKESIINQVIQPSEVSEHEYFLRNEDDEMNIEEAKDD